MIAVTNYGIGNLRSVANALTAAGTAFEVVTDPARLVDFDKILVPGVGAFGACMQALSSKGFRQPILTHVAAGKPLLGICVGMQLLAERGEEFGEHDGLGLIPGKVVQIPDNGIRLPHIGWNALQVTKECALTRDLPLERSAYFLHSFHFVAEDASDVAALVEYGSPVTAAIARGNIYGVQFHPEKSQMVGLAVLRNFAAV
jgi:glutamine amidotransferase